MQKGWTDNQLIGLITGILVPLLMAYLIYYFRFSGRDSFSGIIEELVKLKSLGKLLSVSVVPNLIFFFLFLSANKEKTARGLLGATILWGITAGILFIIR